MARGLRFLLIGRRLRIFDLALFRNFRFWRGSEVGGSRLNLKIGNIPAPRRGAKPKGVDTGGVALG
jgi:hypothetical protein